MIDDHNLNSLSDRCTECIKDKQYGALMNLLKTICYATDDMETLAQLDEVAREMPIDLDKFEDCYFKSMGLDGRRSFIFRDIGKVRAELVPTLFQRWVMEPMNRIAVKKLGALSRSKGAVISSFIKGKASIASEFGSKEPEVIYDA